MSLMLRRSKGGVIESVRVTELSVDEMILGMSSRPRIAIAGKLASGKTTAALALVEQLGFRKMALADSLKEIATDIADWLAVVPNKIGPLSCPGDHIVMRELSDALKDKTTPLGRTWLQWLGTEGLRSRLPDIWIQILLRRIGELPPDTKIVTDDVRFWNEAEALTRAGFLLVRVSTPEHVRRDRVSRLYPQYDDSVFRHLSETALDDWTALDFTLDGGADIEEFKSAIVVWAKSVLKI